MKHIMLHYKILHYSENITLVNSEETFILQNPSFFSGHPSFERFIQKIL